MQVGKLALACAILLGNSVIASADPTTPQEIGQAMCQRFTTAFNAKDLDAQMALYTDDATQVSPDQGMIVGSEARKKGFTDDVSAARSVCASAISGNSGVGEKPLSADASTAWASAGRSVE